MMATAITTSSTTLGTRIRITRMTSIMTKTATMPMDSTRVTIMEGTTRAESTMEEMDTTMNRTYCCCSLDPAPLALFTDRDVFLS